MKKQVLAATAMAAVLSFAITSAAQAADAKTEKCYGVVKAGKNDCKTAAHSCAGASKMDGGAEFVSVPEGLCAKLTNGTTSEPKAEKMEEKKMDEKK